MASSTKDLSRYTNIAVVGPPKSGKSSVILRITGERIEAKKKYPRLLPPKLFELKAFGRIIYLQFIEINDENMNNADFTLQECDGVLIVVDENSTEKESAVDTWLEKATKHKKPVFVVQNKADEGQQKQLSTSALEKYTNCCFNGSVSCKARTGIENIVLSLCQFAYFPQDVIYDAEREAFTKLAHNAFQKIYWILDADSDGQLDSNEFDEFEKALQSGGFDADLEKPQTTNYETYLGILYSFVTSGKFEPIWGLLRTYYYDDSLSVDDIKFAHEYIPEHTTETDVIVLSQTGRRVLADLHQRFDLDGDSLLSQEELVKAFQWIPEKDSLLTVVSQFTNDAKDMCQTIDGKMTLTGWQALWSYTTRQDPYVLLRCLCHWGVKVNLDGLLDVKKKRDYRKTPEDMPDTIQCYIFGATRTGKTSLLRSFIGQEFDSEYTKTEEQHSVVHLFEYKEKNYYLVITELQDIEVPVILRKKESMDNCDVACLVYDANDQYSFLNLGTVQKDLPNTLPRMFVASKLDLEEVEQQFDVTPEEFCDRLQLVRPRRISVAGTDEPDVLPVTEVWKELVLAAVNPELALPEWDETDSDSDSDDEPIVEKKNVILKRVVRIGLAVGVASLIGYAIYRFGFKKNGKK